MTKSVTKLPFGPPTLERARFPSDLPRDVIVEWDGIPDLHPHRMEGGSHGAGQAVDDGDGSSPVRLSSAQFPVHGESAPIHRAKVREYVIDDEAVLFDMTTHTLYYLNQSAFRVWCGCEGRTIRDLTSEFTQGYDVDSATAGTHIRQIVDLFALGGLLSGETTDARQA